jgi:hypothetical protein
LARVVRDVPEETGTNDGIRPREKGVGEVVGVEQLYAQRMWGGGTSYVLARQYSPIHTHVVMEMTTMEMARYTHLSDTIAKAHLKVFLVQIMHC